MRKNCSSGNSDPTFHLVGGAAESGCFHAVVRAVQNSAAMSPASSSTWDMSNGAAGDRQGNFASFEAVAACTRRRPRHPPASHPCSPMSSCMRCRWVCRSRPAARPRGFGFDRRRAPGVTTAAPRRARRLARAPSVTPRCRAPGAVRTSTPPRPALSAPVAPA